jgi:oligopeptide transport system permease protein
MLSFVLRRLLVAIPTMFLVVTLAFFMMRAAPGSPFEGNRKLTPEIERAVNAKYGLDKPLPVQYLHYLGDVLHGDFGPSMKYRSKTVVDIVRESFPKSLTLGISAIVGATIIGVALGVTAALRQNRAADYFATTVAILGVCIPTFVTAPLLVLLFASALGWLPTAGWGGVRNLILPVTVLGLPQVAIISRLTRAGMIEVLGSNYVRTARAKGLSERRIVFDHALRGAMLPQVSYLGPAAAGLITGSLVVEQIFNLPGIGRYFVISALQRDYTVVMGVVILYAGLILVLNQESDILYAVLDPRVKLS